MADSLCGPSNALQSFQKHSTVDRTLQQDRLVARQSPSQGFRSPPGRNAGLLDNDFNAFQAGQLPLEPQQGFQQPFSTPHTPQKLQQPGLSNWASDFQSLKFSNSPSPQHNQPQFRVPPQQIQNNGRQMGFGQQRQSGMPMNQMATSGSPMGMNMAMNAPPGMNAEMWMSIGEQAQFASQVGPQQGFGPQAAQPFQQPVEAFDEAAFARAFDEAMAEDKGKEKDVTQSEHTEQVMLAESAERFMLSETIPKEDQIPDQPRLGADIIHDPSSQNFERPTEEDPDEISRTARYLLTRVQGNTSTKFANSEFLDLMRQFRDKQVVVEGDQIIDAAGEELGVQA